MFGRDDKRKEDKKPAARPDDAAVSISPDSSHGSGTSSSQPTARSKAMIGQSIKIKGTIEGAENLVIDGTVEGSEVSFVAVGENGATGESIAVRWVSSSASAASHASRCSSSHSGSVVSS